MSRLYLKPPTSRPAPAWDSAQGKVPGQAAIINTTNRRGRFVLWMLRRIGVLR